MDFKIIYEDEFLLVIDKPAGIVVFPEGENNGERSRTIIELLLEKYPQLKNTGKPPRYGVVHRLDKDTSGILLVAKDEESLIFFQKQFKNREVEKKYLCLVNGQVVEQSGEIKTLIARSPSNFKKQTNYAADEEGPGRRLAITEFKVVERFSAEGGYTLLEIFPKTGRKHQIRVHLAFIHHPIAGDKLYGFRDSNIPEDLNRHFLHASYLKINGRNGLIKEFDSPLPEDLENVLNKLK